MEICLQHEAVSECLVLNKDQPEPSDSSRYNLICKRMSFPIYENQRNLPPVNSKYENHATFQKKYLREFTKYTKLSFATNLIGRIKT